MATRTKVSTKAASVRPASRRLTKKSATDGRKGRSRPKSKAPAFSEADDCGRGVPSSATRLWKALESGYSAGCQACRLLFSVPAEFAGRVDAGLSLATGIKLRWTSSLLTAGGAAAGYANRRAIGQALSVRLHDRPGHLASFADVNAWIDQRRGRHHRIKHGHSPEAIGELLRLFGPRGIPGYVVHISQDFLTADGIPYLPYARCAVVVLQKVGLRGSVAAGLVTVNVDKAIAIYCLAKLGWTACKVGYTIASKVRQRWSGKEKAVKQVRVSSAAKSRVTA